MKKNLRIVSAAAAALLAVAPVAASAVSVNADTTITVGGNSTPVPDNANINLSSGLTATASVRKDTNQPYGANNVLVPGSLTGTINASYNGVQYKANLDNGSVTEITDNTGNGHGPISTTNSASIENWVKGFQPKHNYTIQISGVSLNFGGATGNDNTGKTLKLHAPSNMSVVVDNGNNTTTINAGETKEVKTNANGVVTLKTVTVTNVYATNTTNAAGVVFLTKDLGTVVPTGSLTTNADAQGNANVSLLVDAINKKYGAVQVNLDNGNQEGTVAPMTNAELAAALRSQGIKVDNNGYFTAPHTLTFNWTATSNDNNAKGTLPITVTFANVAEAPAAQETTKNVKIMHISTVYDKDGKATTEPALRAYNTVSVVSEPVTIKGAKFYKLAGKDQYIKVGNVDGTSRTLKHNSYVYKSSGKRANKKTLKKGSSVTTYGKSFMIAGHQMYRIGENQYVKKANF